MIIFQLKTLRVNKIRKILVYSYINVENKNFNNKRIFVFIIL